MKRRTQRRMDMVLELIKTPKTVRDVQQACGITYLNAYYTLQALKDDKKCHILRWSIEHGNKPQAVFICGEGYDAILGGDVGRTKDEVISADRALREAVSKWVSIGESNDEEQQGEA